MPVRARSASPFVPSVGCSLLPPTLSRFAEAYPGIKLVFHEAQAVGVRRAGAQRSGRDRPRPSAAARRTARLRAADARLPGGAAAHAPSARLAGHRDVEGAGALQFHPGDQPVERARACRSRRPQPPASTSSRRYVLDSLTTAVGLVRAGLAMPCCRAWRCAAWTWATRWPAWWSNRAPGATSACLRVEQFSLSPAAIAFAAIARDVAPAFPGLRQHGGAAPRFPQGCVLDSFRPEPPPPPPHHEEPRVERGGPKDGQQARKASAYPSRRSLCSPPQGWRSLFANST